MQKLKVGDTVALRAKPKHGEDDRALYTLVKIDNLISEVREINLNNPNLVYATQTTYTEFLHGVKNDAN